MKSYANYCNYTNDEVLMHVRWVLEERQGQKIYNLEVSLAFECGVMEHADITVQLASVLFYLTRWFTVILAF